MAVELTKQEAKRRLCAKTRWAREQSKHKQHEIAELLGIDRSAYSKYEWRTPMPTLLIPRFCLIVRVDQKWLLNPFELPPELVPDASGSVRRRPTRST